MRFTSLLGLFSASTRQSRHFRSRPGAGHQGRRLCGELLEDRCLLSASPQLIRDINTETGNFADQPGAVDAGGTIYLIGDDGVHGRELWKTDGSVAGTVLVKDILPGAASPFPEGNDGGLTAVGNSVFFLLADPVNGTELWKSDGTDAGTVLVKDLFPPQTDATVNDLTGFDSALFFSTFDPALGWELWRSDGTEAGTGVFVDINPSGDSNPSQLTVVGDQMFFVANDGTHGDELWATDGSVAGTHLVKDLQPGASGFSYNFGELAAVGSTLFFSYDDGVHGKELWKSDGTEAGTQLVKDIFPAEQGSNPSSLTAVGNTLFFSAEDPDHGVELWTSDGTEAGTNLFLDIDPSFSSNPSQLFNADGRLYFVVSQTNTDLVTHHPELWTSDGTPEGTHAVWTIAPGDSNRPTVYANFAESHGRFFFTFVDNATGEELYTSDGTPAGTGLVKDIWSGPRSSAPQDLLPLAGGSGPRVLFTAQDGLHGRELWTSDGTAAGSQLLLDVNQTTTLSSEPNGYTLFGNQVIFTAFDPVHGAEPWVSDGTAAGTALLADLVPGSGDSGPYGYAAAGGQAFFLVERTDAVSNQAVFQVYRTDGTSQGTLLLHEFSAVRALSGDEGSQEYFHPFAGGVLFAADDGVHGVELWKSDGTAAGTMLLKDIYVDNTGADPGIDLPPNTDSDPVLMAELGSELLFSAWTPQIGRELWATDGTEGGTRLVADIAPGSPGSLGGEGGWAVFGGELYFRANDGQTGSELWKTDGTTVGTVLVKDILAGADGSSPSDLTVAGSLLYFSAVDADHGYELWKSDGTEAGTMLVKDIVADTGSSNPSGLFPVNGTLFFVADDGVHGSELWKSDGSEVGTQLVKDISVSGSSNPWLFHRVGNTLVFAATDDEHGQELFRSDGTEEGTFLLADLTPGPDWTNFNPGDFVVLGDTMFLVSDSSSLGPSAPQFQLWQTDGTSEGTAPVDFPTAPNGLAALHELRAVDGDLLLTVDDRIHGQEPWLLQVANAAPSGLSLSSSTVAENLPAGSPVGLFSTADPDLLDHDFAYTLVAGEGGTDNAAFTIVGNELRTNAVFDFETKANYSIRVRTSDAGGLSYEQAFTVAVQDVNLAPTELALFGSTVPEGLPVGTTVGQFGSADSEPPAGPFTYSLVAGAGSDDNGAFTIVGDQLRTNAVFDFASKASYSIRVRTTDAGGALLERNFTILVLPQRAEMPGLYVPGTSVFYLRDSQNAGPADHAFNFGPEGSDWVELAGDWNGDGQDTVGLYNPHTSTFYLRNSLEPGAADITFDYGVGSLGWIPLVGDWNGDGKDTIGLYDPGSGLFFLKNSLSGGDADEAFDFGITGQGWRPIAGNWDNLPGDGIGFYVPSSSVFFLKNAHGPGAADIAFAYGVGGQGWQPVVGNWDGVGPDGVGLYAPSTSTFFLRNALSDGVADATFDYGVGGLGWRPVAGAWRPPSSPAAGAPVAGIASSAPSIAAAVDRSNLAALAAAQLSPQLDDPLTDILGDALLRRRGLLR